jgi:hypothetical protein
MRAWRKGAKVRTERTADGRGFTQIGVALGALPRLRGRPSRVAATYYNSRVNLRALGIR